MDFLKALVNTIGVSGREGEVSLLIKNELTENKFEFEEDKLGNIIVKKGNGKEKLMISAHMDEVGFMTTYIEKGGFLRVANIGEINPKNKNGAMISINGYLGKLINENSEENFNSIYVDMLMEEKKVNINIKEGDIGVFDSIYREEEDYIIGRNLTSRGLCFILMEVLKSVELEKYEVYFVFTVQNELKGRGARAAAFSIKPDLSIVLEGENSEDYLGGNGRVTLNNGPVLRLIDSSLIPHHHIIEIIEKAAKGSEISLQKILSKDRSEGGELHKEIEGIKTGVIALPIRYKHSSLEMIGRRDLNNIAKLLVKVIQDND